MHAINQIIIFLIGLITIREIIAAFFYVPRDKKWSWLIYNKNDENMIKFVLQQLNLNDKKLNRLSKIDYPIHEMPSPVHRLISLLSRHIYKSNDHLSYGKDTIVNTRYYVNTMEAIHDRSDAVIMCTLIQKLIASESCHASAPDFIITPKLGNPLLAYKYAEQCEIMFVISKPGDDLDKSRARNAPEEFSFKINYEGAKDVIDRARNLGRKLNGVALDCNVSNGSQLKSTVDNFNKYIEKLDLPINKIEYGITLFKVDDKDDLDFKDMQHTQSFIIMRYFDLSEKVKEMIYSKSQEYDEKYLNFNNDGSKKDINDIFTEISKENHLEWTT